MSKLRKAITAVLRRMALQPTGSPAVLGRANGESGPSRKNGQALLILVGITAGWAQRRQLLRFFQTHSDYEVFVPALPYGRPLHEVVPWLDDYLENEVRPERYEHLHAIAYIAARPLLHCLPVREAPMFDRAVFFRAPYQELVAARLVRRVGPLLASLIAGRSILDLADGWPGRLPSRRQALHEALIVEEGRSRLARLLGIASTDIPKEGWTTSQLLPTAEAVLHIPQSHDDVYTCEKVLVSALEFVRQGGFPRMNTGVRHADADRPV